MSNKKSTGYLPISLQNSPGIYILLSSEYDVLYVGMSRSNCMKRIISHKDGGRIPFEYYRVIPTCKAMAPLVEAYMIASMKPPFNVNGVGSRVSNGLLGTYWDGMIFRVSAFLSSMKYLFPLHTLNNDHGTPGWFYSVLRFLNENYESILPKLPLYGSGNVIFGGAMLFKFELDWVLNDFRNGELGFDSDVMPVLQADFDKFRVNLNNIAPVLEMQCSDFYRPICAIYFEKAKSGFLVGGKEYKLSDFTEVK